MDPALVPRVKKYLENNIDKSNVDINTMADYLQRNYREYGRRKRSAFRAIVKKAYGVVVQSYGGPDGRDEGVGEDNTSSEEDDDDNVVKEQGISKGSSVGGGHDRRGNPFRGNQMANQQIVDLYSRPQIPKRIDENELIDVSSGDSEPDVEAVHSQSNNSRIGNGPSISQHGPSISAPLAATSTLRRGVPPQTQRNTSLPVVDYNMAGGGNNMRGKKRKASEVPSLARAKKKKSAATLIEPTVTLHDVGGIRGLLPKIVKLVMGVLFHDEFKAGKRRKSPGVLLHGPRGCGKTLLANAIAGQLRWPLLQVTASELVGGVSGESEERIRDLFEGVGSHAGPCVLFIDDIHTIAPNQENSQKEMNVRIVSQLIKCLDGLAKIQNRVLVIGATNRPDAIDPRLRVAGRFDKELRLGVPDKRGRAEIFKILTCDVRLASDVDVRRIVRLTPGYVGADLEGLIAEAWNAAICRPISTQLEQKKLERAGNKQPSGVISTPAQKKANSTVSIAAAERAATSSSSSTPTITAKNSNKNSDSNNKKVTMTNDKDGDDNKDDNKPSTTTIEPAESTTKTTEDVISTGISNKRTEAAGPDDAEKSTSDNNGVIKIAEDAPQILDIVDEDVQEVDPIEQISLEILDAVYVNGSDQFVKDNSQSGSVVLTMDDFLEALKDFQPALRREGFARVPDVTWDDVGSLAHLKEKLQKAIMRPIQYSDTYEQSRVEKRPAGILLVGPPGCGKTLVAKAVANEAEINFLLVNGPELVNMYVGESERAIRVVFERARNSKPCIIFFDELDGICGKRSNDGDGGVMSRLVNQMLAELDGVQGNRDGVHVLAATNRPGVIDPAIKRPGRLGTILYVGLPSLSDRVDILKAITKNGTAPRLAPDVDLEATAAECDGYTGADLVSLVERATDKALDDCIRKAKGDLTTTTTSTTVKSRTAHQLILTNECFRQALAEISPSVSEKDRKRYEKIRKRYEKSR